jgi:hypothetical protein
MEVDYEVCERFKALDSRRQGVLDRNRRCAELSLPHLLTQDGHTEDDQLDEPYQSEGAQGVNNIAAKLQVTLFPPQSSFFALAVSEELLQEFQQQSPAARQEVEDGLMQTERVILEDIEANAMRATIFNALRNLVALGNCCLFIPDKGKAKNFNLDQFVVLRDDAGSVVELIIKETFDPVALTDEQRAMALEHNAVRNDKHQGKADEVDVYTRVYLKDDKYHAGQYIGDKMIPDTKQSYPKDESPWVVARWTEITGENYGRGLIEENYGDFNALEHLSMAVTLSIGIGAKTIFLCDPNGVTDPRKLAKASIGQFVAGREQDVVALRVDKVQDLQGAIQVINDLKRDLRRVFLRSSAVQRQGERVTAEEIRLMADELETAHGGAFSRLAEELQRPILMRIMGRLKRAGKLKQLPKDLVKIRITTGLEAIGRGQDLAKLERAVGLIQAVPGMLEMHDLRNLAVRIYQSLSVDHKGLLKTDEQLQQEQQQAMAQSMVDKAAGPVAGAVAGAMTQGPPEA